MAIAWTLRDQRVTSSLIGARNLEQLNDSLDAVNKLTFTEAELKEIDRHAVEGAIDLWKGAREGTAISGSDSKHPCKTGTGPAQTAGPLLFLTRQR